MKYEIHYKLDEMLARRWGTAPCSDMIGEGPFGSADAARRRARQIRDDPEHHGYQRWLSDAYLWVQSADSCAGRPGG